MKHFYAQYDTTVSKRNPGHGFANSKEAIAFSSKEKRDSFLESRSAFDFTCKAITRKTAMKMLVEVDNNTGDKGLQLDEINFDLHSVLVLKQGR